MYVGVCAVPICMSVYRVCSALRRPKEGLRPPETGVTDDYEPPCGYWELSLAPLEDQIVFLTTLPPNQPLYVPFIAE